MVVCHGDIRGEDVWLPEPDNSQALTVNLVAKDREESEVGPGVQLGQLSRW